MQGFDPELYLRLAGERMLLARDGNRGWSSPLVNAADALIAVDAIAIRAAERVATDYAHALALRDGSWQHRDIHKRPRAPKARTPIALSRIASCVRDIELPSGTLHVRYVALSPHETLVGIKFQTNAPRRTRRGPMMRPSPAHPPTITLGDDRGTTTPAHFSGGGSDREWSGQLHASTPLARHTSWIEFDGVRADLNEPTRDAVVAVQPVEETDPALRHLSHRLAAARHFRPASDSLEHAIAALLAAGALPEDHPSLAELRAVDAALHGGHGPNAPRGRSGLPEPWRSLLARRGRNRGPTGQALIAAATPVFDGISVAALMLESHEDAFDLEVQTKPEIAGHGPEQHVGDRHVAWWARDDRGNHYLGNPGRWSWSDGHSEGSLDFWPALDPKATQLTILATGPTTRAAITTHLPWAQPAAR